MDSGELDFYQHSKVCSNTCRSTKIDLVGTKVSISSDQPAELVPAISSSANCKSHKLKHHTVEKHITQSVSGRAASITVCIAEADELKSGRLLMYGATVDVKERPTKDSAH